MCQLPKALAPQCHRRQVLVSLILRVEKIEAPATLIYVNPQVLGPKSPPASEVMQCVWRTCQTPKDAERLVFT